MRTSFRSVASCFRTFCKNRKGTAAVTFALALIPVLLAAGGAVDFTRYYDAQQTVQTALDAATLAGDSVYDGTNDDEAQSVALKTFNSWSTSVDGTISGTGFTPASSTDALDVTGMTTVAYNMYFTGLIGLRSLKFTVTSKAERTAGTTTSGGSGECIWNRAAVNYKGTLTAESCQVNELAGGSTMDAEASITTQKFCTVTSPANYHTTIVDSDGAESLSDNCTDYTSYKHDVPTVTVPTDSSCTDTNAYMNNNSSDVDISAAHSSSPVYFCSSLIFSGGTITFAPGTYSSVTLQNNASAVFKPGRYIINGTWMFNGKTITGTGVSFYLTSNATVTFNSGSTSTLSAPTTDDCGTEYGVDMCDYAGTLFFESDDSSGSNDFTIDAGNGSDWTGLIYLPNRYLRQNSGSYMSHSGDLVTNGMFLGASSTWIQSDSGTTTSTSTYSAPRLIK